MGEEGLAAAVGVGGGEVAAERASRKSCRVPQNEPSKSQRVFCFPRVLHPQPLPWRQQSGGASNRALGRSLLPSLLPQQRWLWGGAGRCCRLGSGWREAAIRTVELEGLGKQEDRAASSCPGWLAAPCCAEARGAASEKGRGHCSPCPAIRGQSGEWEACPHLPSHLWMG